jgi:D-serine deaminase-like pyridoxal phosphate-dependent protein
VTEAGASDGRDGAEEASLDLEHHETPVGVVDLERVRANAARAVAYATAHGLGWRPHIKTHKSRRIARLQLDAGARGLTVATLREAEVMAALTDDLLLAYPPVGEAKLTRLVGLPPGLDLKVALDSAEVLEPLARRAAGAGRSIGVLVEQDVGMRRVGLPDPDAVVDLALRVADSDGVEFRGILFYPGHIRMRFEEQAEAFRAASERLAQTLDALAAAGLVPEIVSGGSTPTLWRSHEMAGLTEVRSGSCIYNDREAFDLGTASAEELAYTVLATVVSTSVPGQAVVDAGSKALAKESRGADGGFGILLDRPEIVVSGLSEEHGIIDLSGSDWRPRVGDRVRIVPNHVCVSVNLQDRLLARSGDRVEELELEGRGRGAWTR